MRHPSVGWMSRALPAVAAAAVLGLGGAARAQAEPRPLTLAWDAPAGCPAADQVLGDVARTLAEPGGAPTPVMATVRVAPGPGGVWQASLILEVRGARTERRFRAESCDAIAAATAVILAIAVQDASEAPAHPTTTLPAPRGESPPPPRAPAVSAAWTSHLFAMASGLVDWDTMPSAPALGYEATFGRSWDRDRWRLRWVAATDFFPRQSPPDTAYIGRANGAFWLLGVSGRGCLGVAISRMEIGPCLGAELVAMHASDGGSPSNPTVASLANQTEYWLALLASMAASWNVSGALDVVLRADLVVPTTRPTFSLKDSGLYDYQVPGLAFRGALGFQVRFP